MMHALCTICEYNGYLGDNTYLDGGNMRKRFARINFSSIKAHVTFSLVLGINTTARVFSPVKSQVNDNAADSDEHLSRITLVFIPKISRPSRDVDW